MTNITLVKKAIAGSLAALTLAAGLVALSPTTASAHGGWGPGFAAGVVGGLAAGALAAGAAGAYGPYYYDYYGPAAYPYPYPYPYPTYGGCYFAPRRVWNGYRWVIRRVEICP